MWALVRTNTLARLRKKSQRLCGQSQIYYSQTNSYIEGDVRICGAKRICPHQNWKASAHSLHSNSPLANLAAANNSKRLCFALIFNSLISILACRLQIICLQIRLNPPLSQRTQAPGMPWPATRCYRVHNRNGITHYYSFVRLMANVLRMTFILFHIPFTHTYRHTYTQTHRQTYRITR